MCGRFNVIDNPALRELLRELGIDLDPPAGVNLAPTEMVPLVRRVAPGEGEAAAPAQLDRARWWLTPSWAPRVEQKYAMFNARSETLARSRAFKRPFARQRGVVPMSSFIEWRSEGGSKQPWLISGPGALAVAALWDIWCGGDGEPPLLSCTLVTTAAAPAFEPWHDRMPVMLAPGEWPRWLDNSRPIEPGDDIFRPALKFPLDLVPVSRALGNPRHKEADLLAPLAEPVHLT